MSSQASLPLPSASTLPTSPFQSLRSSYDVVLYLLKDILGFDPGFIVNLSIFIAAASAAGRYIGNFVYGYAKKLCFSSVRINDDDVLYEYLLRWMGDRNIGSRAPRSVKAATITRSTLEEEEETMKSVEQDLDKLDRPISYRTMNTRARIHFRPFASQHVILHRRNLILFKHQLRATELRGERGFLTLECLGRSLSPIRLLLEHVQAYSIEKTASTTGVFRADASWTKTLNRPYRDVKSVIFEKSKKQALLRDINEYLHPRTRKWYSDRGIPYRRGYLFSGAPGTGKTSLTAALAGVFGLDIYVLSLLDPDLSEAKLVRLLGEVPSRCIVLIEDVDAAGLGKRPETTSEKESPTQDTEPTTETAVESTTESVTEASSKKKQQPVTSISLSGLLNAIDGVSSSEGRILIMTTNHPKALDKALIRPGRVDMHVAFELPTRVEMKELYLSMYRDIGYSKGNGETGESGPKCSVSFKGPAGSSQDKTTSLATPRSLIPEELQSLAQTFTDSLPESRLSLAAIQGFLLGYKRNPRMAAEEAKAWADETLKETKAS